MQATRFDRKHNRPLIFDFDADKRALLAQGGYDALFSVEACENIAPLMERVRAEREAEAKNRSRRRLS